MYDIAVRKLALRMVADLGALHGTVGSRETASILQGCVIVDGLQKNMMVFHCPVGRYTIRLHHKVYRTLQEAVSF